MQIFVKTFPQIHSLLTIAGITLFSGFSTATAAGTCTCSESQFLLPATPYEGDYCTTTTTTFTVGVCEDEDICPTLVGLCECLSFGLRDKVQRACPLMCNVCTTTTTQTTTTTTSTTTTSTSTSTTTALICEDKDICPTKSGTCNCNDKCNHPLVGPRLQLECPVMCGVCGSTTTVTTTTTTTTTTATTTTRDQDICDDAPACPTKSGKPCDCEHQCWNPLIGPELRANCPVMCNVCSTTTTVPTTTTTTTMTTTTSTTTRTIPSVCMDDVICPTLVDPQGNDLCLCDSIGDMVRAACPVMCDVCHKCTLPCLSDNLASKTVLTKEVNQTGQCDNPDGIPKGHTCIMAPITHPCVTQSVLLTCPTDNNVIGSAGKLQTKCQVCGGVMSEYGDVDPRPGHIEVEISWGPNSFEGVINEQSVGILGYAVYAVNECGEREGTVLATVTAYGIQEGTQPCCEKRMYVATIQLTLPYGGTSKSFMVVPLTSIGALDVGWVTTPVADSTVPVTRAIVSSPQVPPVATDPGLVSVPEELAKVALAMTMNVDYQKLREPDKDDFKGKVQNLLVETADKHPHAEVFVSLIPGSVSVYAEIRIPNKNSAESIAKSMTNNLDSFAREVLEAAASIPGFKAAAVGELKVTILEVKTDQSQAWEGTLSVTAVSPPTDVSPPSPEPETFVAANHSQPNPQTVLRGPRAAPGAPDEAQDAETGGNFQMWLIATIVMGTIASLSFIYAFFKKKRYDAEATPNNGSSEQPAPANPAAGDTPSPSSSPTQPTTTVPSGGNVVHVATKPYETRVKPNEAQEGDVIYVKPSSPPTEKAISS